MTGGHHIHDETNMPAPSSSCSSSEYIRLGQQFISENIKSYPACSDQICALMNEAIMPSKSSAAAWICSALTGSPAGGSWGKALLGIPSSKASWHKASYPARHLIIAISEGSGNFAPDGKKLTPSPTPALLPPLLLRLLLQGWVVVDVSAAGSKVALELGIELYCCAAAAGGAGAVSVLFAGAAWSALGEGEACAAESACG
jgi:hypothetical protein